jgi:hypothetical protein
MDAREVGQLSGWIVVAGRLREIVVGEVFGSSVVGTRNGADR